MRFRSHLTEVFRPGSGARQLLASTLFFGAAYGAFYSVLTNFLAEVVKVDEQERGVIEFFRETPGLLLIFILALMHRFSEWKILRTGSIIAMLGVAGMFFAGTDKLLLTVLIMVWSAGEHILMPARNSIAMHVARPGQEGASLGWSGSANFLGNVSGSIFVALVFFLGLRFFGASQTSLYNLVWAVVLLLTAGSFLCAFPPKLKAGEKPLVVARPRLYFRKKFSKFYILELFYGARKQIFLTFAPFVLVKEFGMSTAVMAVMVGLCATVNIYFGPLIGRLIDRWGYRNVMIYDTVVLFFVCIIYGFARQLFSFQVAYFLVCLNFLLDAIISTASMASSIYVREISDSNEEITATLTTGISVNHFISVFAALLGGLIWKHLGVQALFIFAGVMALFNSVIAATITRPRKDSA